MQRALKHLKQNGQMGDATDMLAGFAERQRLVDIAVVPGYGAQVQMSARTPVLIVGGGPVGPGARRRARLARRALHADREDRRLDRAAEDGPRRHPHHGVLPALGHPRLGPRRALPARLSAGLRLRHRAQRLRAWPRAVPRPRLRALPAREPAEARARAAGHVRSDPATLRGAIRTRRRCATTASSFRSAKRRTACARRCATRRPARPRPSKPTTWSAPTAAPRPCASSSASA